MSDLILKIGQTIETQDGRHGTVRYVGTLHIAAGEWLGLELSDETGKNDGSVKGTRYFQCKPGYGIFVRKESASAILKQPTPPRRTVTTSPAPNGPAAKSRPSAGVGTDVTRKRQSLVGGAGAGSGSATGSRLSIRSPTKSPTKATHSSATLTTSTPRTSTPSNASKPLESGLRSRLSTTGRASMAPPATTTRSTASGPRPSLSGVSSRTNSRPSGIGPRSSVGGTRSSLQPKPATRQSLQASFRPAEENDSVKSSPILEEADAEESQDESQKGGDQEDESEGHDLSPVVETAPQPAEPARASMNSLSRNASTSVEARTAQKREVEQLKAAVRTLEKKVLEGRERTKSIDALQAEKDRYEGIIQALQKKARANQQEMTELRTKCEEANARVTDVPDRSAEFESELELATLDKEMAEERADMYQAELEALKATHEELELEAEILREENRELGSVMSPEEKASAGWLQMEREQERLREALRILRDVSKQNEVDLRMEVKELQDSLDKAIKTAGMYDTVSEKLARSEETKKHLMEQLEAAETNDEVFEAMQAQKEQDTNVIEQLRKQVQDLEEHIQVTDELEAFHVEEEKRLHFHLDENEALLSERLRRANEQDKVIEDLEYTLTKFREVVSGLQRDIDDLRRSRDISEVEAHEMSSKSRAMMDLNLQLQNTAAKTQLKAIDLEMGKMRTDQASSHLEIVQLYVPETFDSERNPVLALLCFKRIVAKANLVKNILSERMRDRPHLTQDDPFSVLEVVEKMSWIALCCTRFIRFVLTSSPEAFARYSGAPFELEPVERSITLWIEALRRDEMGSDGPEHLHRMISILEDMSDKLILESNESKATELVIQSSMVECYADSVAQQLSLIVKAVQIRLGPANDEDEDSVEFDTRMDQFGTKARTVKYLCGKLVQSLKELCSNHMCLAETTWVFFEDAENAAQQISRLVRNMGNTIFNEYVRLERDDELSYRALVDLITSVVKPTQTSLQNGTLKASSAQDGFSLLNIHLQQLHDKVDDLTNKSLDINSCIEFEPLTSPPWVVRAKEIKNQKLVSQDIQEELVRLKTRSQEQTARLGEKDKLLEEQQIRVQLLESRTKENKVRDESVKAMKDEIERLKTEKENAEGVLERLKTEYTSLLQASENEKAAAQKMGVPSPTANGFPIGAGGTGFVDEVLTQQLKTELDLLVAQNQTLESAVRFLKAENHKLRVPVGEIALNAAQNAWLHPASLPTVQNRRKNDLDLKKETIKRERQHVLLDLIELSEDVKPVVLKSRKSPASVMTKEENQTNDGSRLELKTWQAQRDTTRYLIARQREALENWVAKRNEVVKKAKIMLRTPDAEGKNINKRMGTGNLGKDIEFDPDAGEIGVGVGMRGVRIVESESVFHPHLHHHH